MTRCWLLDSEVVFDRISRRIVDMRSSFEAAVSHVGSSQVPSDTQTKLQVRIWAACLLPRLVAHLPRAKQLYALYKIATVSTRPAPGSRPGMLDFTGRAKWDAWDRVGAQDGGVSADEAKRRYVQLAEERFDFRDQSGSQESTSDVPGTQRGTPHAPAKQERMVAVSMLTSDFVDDA